MLYESQSHVPNLGRVGASKTKADLPGLRGVASLQLDLPNHDGLAVIVLCERIRGGITFCHEMFIAHVKSS